MTEPAVPQTAPKQPFVLLVLILLLLGGLLVIGFMLVNALEPAAVAAVPTYRPTNTPDMGTDIGIIPISPPQALSDFVLTRDDGDLIALDDLAGKYALIYFGYTECPDFCPLTLAQFVNVKARLAERANRFNFVLISLDPARDSLGDIRAYLDQFDPSFIGIQGEDAVLQSIAPDYGLSYTTGGDHAHHGGVADSTASAASETTATPAVITALDGGLLINHTTYTYLVDPEGRLRSIIAFNTSADAILREIERVLAEG
ncbi:MAG: SCO family protein [bacterium]|nr:SCO family protein [bacterium]